MEDETIMNEEKTVCVCGSEECKCGKECMHEVAAENAKWGEVGYDIPGVFYPIYLCEGIIGAGLEKTELV